MIFRVRYALAGAHVHCRLFSGQAEGALGKCGDFVMRLEEFRAFMAMKRWIHFVPEFGAQVVAAPEDGRPTLEGVAEYCLDPMKDDDHASAAARIIAALHDSFDLGFKAAGGTVG
jgi:hypothetical protein